MKQLDGDLILQYYRRPTEQFATLANTIGHAAWSERFDARPGSVSHTFDPDDSGRLYQKMRRSSAHLRKFVGLLAAVGTDEGQSPVGVIWGFNDTSGSLGRRALKRVLGQQPYAVTTQVNVLPAFQGHGIGTRLQHDYLSHFNPGQKPSTYVFEENEPTLDWFQRMGYRLTPGVRELDAYFGAEAPPVRQLRLEAVSAAAVQSTIAQAYPDLIVPGETR